MKVEEEYKRLRDIFADGTDEKLMEAIDGAIWEAARIRCQLDGLNELAEVGGLVRFNPKNPAQQKIQPVARTITQVRASYINYISKISKLLGAGTIEEEDDGFADY